MVESKALRLVVGGLSYVQGAWPFGRKVTEQVNEKQQQGLHSDYPVYRGAPDALRSGRQIMARGRKAPADLSTALRSARDDRLLEMAVLKFE